MNCKNCNEPIQEGQQVCEKCRAKIEDTIEKKDDNDLGGPLNFLYLLLVALGIIGLLFGLYIVSVILAAIAVVVLIITIIKYPNNKLASTALGLTIGLIVIIIYIYYSLGTICAGLE